MSCKARGKPGQPSPKPYPEREPEPERVWQPGYRVLTRNHTQGYNGGVGLQHLERLRSSAEAAPFRRALQLTLASTEMRRGGPLAGGGALEASWTSGEQDVLTLLDLLAPREAWARWMWPLPCGWNWQMCHSIIASEGGNGYAVATDDTCGDAPRLLHFNCGRAFKELLKKERLRLDSSGPNTTAHNANAVRRALRSPHASRTCRAASRRVPNVQARHCNVSFLFGSQGRSVRSAAEPPGPDSPPDVATPSAGSGGAAGAAVAHTHSITRAGKKALAMVARGNKRKGWNTFNASRRQRPPCSRLSTEPWRCERGL